MSKQGQNLSTAPRHEKWEIAIAGDRVSFRRIHNGVVTESYAPAALDIASLYAAAIIQGFEPPRGRRRLDTPADQTPPAADHPTSA